MANKLQSLMNTLKVDSTSPWVNKNTLMKVMKAIEEGTKMYKHEIAGSISGPGITVMCIISNSPVPLAIDMYEHDFNAFVDGIMFNGAIYTNPGASNNNGPIVLLNSRKGFGASSLYYVFEDGQVKVQSGTSYFTINSLTDTVTPL